MNYDFLNVAVAGPALFLLTALVFGLFKPKYRPLHNTISELALGQYGYVQTVNFTVSGLLIMLLGLRLAAMHQHIYGSVAVAVLGAVLLLSAIFRTDPITANGSTTTGKVHNILFFIGILGIISAQFVTGFSSLGSALGFFSLACGALALLGLPITITRQTYMGLFQRALVSVVMLWVAVLALSVLG